MKYLAAVTLLLFSFVVAAQTKGSPEEKAKFLTETIMKSDLGLTQEQTEKVYNANLDMFKKILKEESSGGSIREIRNFMLDRNKALKTILSAEQYHKFEQNLMGYQEKIEEKFNR